MSDLSQMGMEEWEPRRKRLLTLTNAIEAFLAEIETDRTRESYQTGLRSLASFLFAKNGKQEPILVSALSDAGVLVDFRRWLMHRKPVGVWSKSSTLSDQTVRCYVAAAVAFMGFLYENSELPEIQRAVFLVRRDAKKRRSPYPVRTTDPSLPKVVIHYDNVELPPANTVRSRALRLIVLRNRAILHTLYSTAARVSEVAALTRESVREGRAAEVIITGKGGIHRTLFFTKEAQTAIRAYLKERTDGDSALFVGHWRRGRISMASIWRILKDAAALEGLKDVHPHDLRHFRATQWLNEGMPLETVQALLGHQDISTTQRVYAHVAKPAMREAFGTYGLSPAEALGKVENE